MGDAGEGLIDAEDRFQQWEADREQQKQRKGVASADPLRERRLASLRLARAELAGQQSVTTSQIRRKQIEQALAEIDRQLAALGAKPAESVLPPR
jgi:hypothetical protein